MNYKIATCGTLVAGAMLLSGVTASAAVTTSVNLGVGSRGTDVVSLQTFLESRGYLVIPAGTAKGYFGTLTKTALANYQKSKDVPPTGMYDTATASMVNADAGASTSMTMKPTSATKAADLRAAMHDILVEHVTSSIDVLKDIADNNANSMKGALQEQDANAVDLATAIGSIYGTDAQNAFLKMFRDHITDSNAYTQGLKDKNLQNQQDALAKLDQQLVSISSFLSGANPNIDNATLLGALRQHEDLINKSSTAYVNGDYTGAYNYERQAVKQIAGGADYLSEAIVKQFPAKF